jgi:hypothetical protein
LNAEGAGRDIEHGERRKREGIMLRLGGIVVIISVYLCSISPCHAIQTSNSNSFTLKGIKAVFILVEDLPQEAVAMGLTTESIKAAVASNLEQAGLSVPDYSIEDPYLAMSIHVVEKAFSIEVSLRENVALRRDTSITCRAATWMKNVTGVHRGDPGIFIDGVQRVLDSFLNDLHEANPKKKLR